MGVAYPESCLMWLLLYKLAHSHIENAKHWADTSKLYLFYFCEMYAFNICGLIRQEVCENVNIQVYIY